MYNNLKNYHEEVSEKLNNLDVKSINLIKNSLIDTIRKRKTIHILGTGIFSTVADHLSNDLCKSGGHHVVSKLGYGVRALSMHANMSLLTALANDTNYEDVYAQSLKILSHSDDSLIIFTCGEPHGNIIEAAKFAYEKGMKVIVICGKNDTTFFENYSDLICKIPTDDTLVALDIQLFLCHHLTARVNAELTLPVVFLDRDGVINEDRDDYIKSWEEFKFNKGVSSAIKRLNGSGYVVVVITNQSVINRGIVSENELTTIHDSMNSELNLKGAIISKVYYCPHTPAENCECRKPKTKLFKKALDELPIDISNSFMIGDRKTDIQAGTSFNLKTILLKNQDIEIDNDVDVDVDFVCNNLVEAVDIILSRNLSAGGIN